MGVITGINKMKTESWPEVIVVAPGKSLLDMKCGEYIDGFPVVLRFLGLKPTMDIRPYVGAKTDIFMFNLGVRGVQLFELYVTENSIPTKNILGISSESLPERWARVHKAIENKDYDLSRVPLSDVLRMKECLYLKNIYPSSGLMAVDYLLQRHARVCVHGFDRLAYGLEMADDYRKIYEDDEEHRSKEYVAARHDYEREAIYLKALESAGKVVPLSTLIA
jgi:hypothetical protein